MNKLKTIWTLIRSKHYLLIESDDEQEIEWALKTLVNVDESLKLVKKK